MFQSEESATMLSIACIRSKNIYKGRPTAHELKLGAYYRLHAGLTILYRPKRVVFSTINFYSFALDFKIKSLHMQIIGHCGDIMLEP